MADANSIRIVYIFEVCARLRCPTEISALAAHIYHRFFRINLDMSQFELNTFGSACVMLAHRFFERELEAGDLATISASVLHGSDCYLDQKLVKKLANSINFTSLIIAINTNFEISFKDERYMTPEDLLRLNRQPRNQEMVELDKSIEIEIEEEDSDDDKADFLLTNNSRHLISSHRYLLHYLYSIRLLLEPISYNLFNRLCNIAWTFLNDFHWSPAVISHLPEHLACACLMMAIESCTKELEKCKEPHKVEYLKFMKMKWNLILCDDLTTKRLNSTIVTIVKHYSEYELIFRKEFRRDVLDI